MNLYLMRHGHRQDDPENPNGAYFPKGRSLDPDISEKGIKQAKETAARLVGSEIKHIYASPFLRTVHTAHHVAMALNLDVRLEWGLAEFLTPGYFEDWPGTIPPQKLAQMFATVDPDYEQTGILPKCPEYDYWEMFHRCHDTTKQLLARHPNEDILIVSHAAGTAAIPPAFIGWQNYEAKAYLCGLTKLVQEGPNWKMELHCDISHLSYTKV